MINPNLVRVGHVTNLETLPLGALVLSLPMLQRMKVAEIINRFLPGDPQLEFDYGTVLSLLVAARFDQPMALDNVVEWARESGAELLWNIPADKLNDDRLGRALDAFYTKRHSILASLALHIVDEFQVPLKDVHYDPTHIVFHGLYEESQPREQAHDDRPTPFDDDQPPAHITRGRQLEDVPDGARLIHTGLCNVVDQYGPVPLYGHTLSGNENGHTAVRDNWSLLQQQLKPPPLTYFSDTGTYSFGHLDRLCAAGSHAVCPAPWKDYRQLYEQHVHKLKWRESEYLSLEQQRRRRQGNLPQEHHELAEIAHTLTDPNNTKRTLAVRVIFLYSTGDEKTCRQQRERMLTKCEGELRTLAERVLAGRAPYNTPERVEQAVQKIVGHGERKKFLHVELLPLTAAEKKALPPLKSGCRPATHRLTVRRDRQAIEEAERYDGLSVLVTTAPAERTADALFTEYKQQTYNEHANHVFKGPLAVSPVYLKTPSRVEALVFLMLIALQLHFLLQREYRRHVPSDAPPKERRTTTATLCIWFESYGLIVRREDGMRVLEPTPLTARQRETLRRLHLPTPAQLLRRCIGRSD